MIEPRPKPGKGDSTTSHNHNASVDRLRQPRKSHNKDKLQGSPCLPVGMLTEIRPTPTWQERCRAATRKYIRRATTARKTPDTDNRHRLLHPADRHRAPSPRPRRATLCATPPAAPGRSCVATVGRGPAPCRQASTLPDCTTDTNTRVKSHRPDLRLKPPIEAMELCSWQPEASTLHFAPCIVPQRP